MDNSKYPWWEMCSYSYYFPACEGCAKWHRQSHRDTHTYRGTKGRTYWDTRVTQGGRKGQVVATWRHAQHNGALERCTGCPWWSLEHNDSKKKTVHAVWMQGDMSYLLRMHIRRVYDLVLRGQPNTHSYKECTNWVWRHIRRPNQAASTQLKEYSHHLACTVTLGIPYASTHKKPSNG